MFALGIGLTAPDLQKVARRAQVTLKQLAEGDLFAMLAAADVYAEIMREELSRPGQGRMYVSKSGDGSTHQASRSGDPPASDTETLLNAIGVDIFGKFVGVGVNESEAPYWRLLEYGTKNMDPRPFVRRALVIGQRGMTDRYILLSQARTARIVAKGRSAK